MTASRARSRIQIDELVLEVDGVGPGDLRAVHDALREALRIGSRDPATGAWPSARSEVDLATVEWNGPRRPADLGWSVGAALAREVGS